VKIRTGFISLKIEQFGETFINTMMNLQVYMIFERHIVYIIREGLIFPSVQYLFFILFINIVCVTTCFGRRRPSSGQDAQFLSQQPHYFLPLFLLHWPMLT
jgi:hypothetical protein